jgi:ribosomal protein S18 acetylase RimI-like enzyme
VTDEARAPEVQVEEVSPTSADAQYCLSRYFDELSARFETGFDAAQSGAPTLDEFRPPRGCFLVMRVHGKTVACGGFKPDADAAYIKRMWVSPDARGLGLGRRLLIELEVRARALGYARVRLETEKSLAEAQQLYRSSGYVEVPPFNDELYAHHWFEKLLT